MPQRLPGPIRIVNGVISLLAFFAGLYFLQSMYLASTEHTPILMGKYQKLVQYENRPILYLFSATFTAVAAAAATGWAFGGW